MPAFLRTYVPSALPRLSDMGRACAAGIGLLALSGCGPSTSDAEHEIRTEFQASVDMDHNPPFGIRDFEKISGHDAPVGPWEGYFMTAQYKIFYSPESVSIGNGGTKRYSGYEQAKAHNYSSEWVFRFINTHNCKEIVPTDGNPNAPYMWQCRQNFRFGKSDKGWNVTTE